MPRTKKKPTSPAENGPPAVAADVLTLAEAAAYLRVGEADVLRLVREQGLAGRQIGSQWRFLKPALQDWLRSGPEKKGLFRHIGALPDDAQTEEMLEEIYRRRRAPVEEA
jgi:excisionase family DNA binding protein